MNGAALDLGSRGDALHALTYKSRAVEELTEIELRELERQSQTRNRREGLTGLTLYEDGQFFQWLEGPASALARVWSSVRRDSRHRAIEGLNVVPTPARLFEGWDMTLTSRGALARDIPDPPESLICALSALDLDLLRPTEPAVEIGKAAGALPVLPLVPVLVEAVVLPKLLSQRGNVRRFLPRVLPDAARLARLLLAEDAAPAEDLLRGLHADAGSFGPLCATVIEPAARNLGDLWSTDDCTEIAMTLALFRLQSVIRDLTHGSARAAIDGPIVLIAPQPGEAHLLGAALDAELLWQAGWETHRESSGTDEALRSMLKDQWFDVLDLSLSTAMRREDSLPGMAKTIAGARLASRNPELTVVVGGREFFDDAAGTNAVGADASTSSSLHVVLAVSRALQKTLERHANRSPQVTRS